jgi:hypothetical protein
MMVAVHFLYKIKNSWRYKDCQRSLSTPQSFANKNFLILNAAVGVLTIAVNLRKFKHAVEEP